MARGDQSPKRGNGAVSLHALAARIHATTHGSGGGGRIQRPGGVNLIAPLAKRFARLEKARAEIESDLRLLSSGQLAFKPHSDSWSIGEVIDHIVRVESSVFEGASRQGVKRSGWRGRPVRRALTWLMFRFGIRIKVPQRVTHVTPEQGANAGEALERWRAVRTAMAGYLETIPQRDLVLLAIKHPIAGPFSYRDFLAFLEWHLRHHRRQIARIRTSPGFPH